MTHDTSSPASLTLASFGPATPHADEALAIFVSTWPDNTIESARAFLARSAAFPHFRALVALVGAKVVAMGFGAESLRGSWWHEKIAERVGPEHPALQHAWALTELAVQPTYRRQGIAGRLHDELLTSQPLPRALLSTEVSNDGARRLYEHRGWQYLHPGLVFNPGREPFVVMHKELVAPSRGSVARLRLAPGDDCPDQYGPAETESRTKGQANRERMGGYAYGQSCAGPR